MRLSELESVLQRAAQSLDLQKEATNIVVSNEAGLRVMNIKNLQATVETLSALGMFKDEIAALAGLVVFASGSNANVWPATPVAQMENALRLLKVAVVRAKDLVGYLLRDPPVAEAGYALRLPASHSYQGMDSLLIGVDALKQLNQATLRIAKEPLQFGGFDVGSAWIQFFCGEAASALIQALVSGAVKFCTERYRIWRAVQAAKDANLPSEVVSQVQEGCEAKVGEMRVRVAQEVMDEYYTSTATKANPEVSPENLRFVEHAVDGLVKVFDGDGEVVGLLVQPPAPTEEAPRPPRRMTVVAPNKHLSGERPAALLSAGREEANDGDPPDEPQDGGGEGAAEVKTAKS